MAKNRFAFWGTPSFAYGVLQKLIDGGFEPVVVICNPDRPFGRKKILTAPPTKELAVKQGIPFLQPEELDGDFKNKLREFKPEFGVVAAYAKIIHKSVIELFPKEIIGVHPSLLPKYRGASPIQSVILAGEEKTGVTLYLMDEKVDHGRIVSSIKYQVSSRDTYLTLEKKLAELGGKLLVGTIPRYLDNQVILKSQVESEATFTKKFETEDGYVDVKELDQALLGQNYEKATEIDRKIRALNPEPGVWTIRGNKRVKLLEAALQNKTLVLKTIQEEGKKPKEIKG